MDAEIRERIAKLEVQVDHLSKQLEAQTAILKRLDETFQQAKGARWVLAAIAGLSGLIAAKGGAILQWLGLVR